MKTLEKNTILQIIIGVVCIVLVLLAGVMLTNKITYPHTQIGILIEKIVAVISTLIYLAFMVLMAIFAKSCNLKYLYYSGFAAGLVSSLSALLHWYIEDCFLLVIMPITRFLGQPIRVIAQAIENKLIYEDADRIVWNYLYENDVLLIFVVFNIISIAVYQLYADTDEHTRKKEQWRLDNPARKVALATILGYGIYFVLIQICYLGDGVFSDTLAQIMGVMLLILTFSGILPTLIPVGLISYLLYTAISQAKEKKDVRQVLNPLVFLAVFLTIAGTVSMILPVIHGF